MVSLLRMAVRAPGGLIDMAGTYLREDFYRTYCVEFGVDADEVLDGVQAKPSAVERAHDRWFTR